MKYANLKTINVQKKQISANWAKKWLVTIVVLTIVIILGAVFAKNAGALFNPISIVANISGANLKETDGRTNILLLGSDRRASGSISTNLTDTLLVASIGKYDKDVVLISIPRDLWVESPKGYHSKINAIYANGGSEEALQVVQSVLGIPIHYYSLVSFDLFKETVNILGGVDVVVDKSFEDHYYPVEGKENAPENERYETVRFEAGAQKMDGETALKYVRSRKGNNDEGTDFARSKRQQKVITAIKTKITSLDVILNPVKLKDLYDAYSKNVDTNVDFGIIQNFYLLSKEIDFSKIKSVVLDDRSAANEGGILYAPEDTSLYGGSYVLIPRSGDFSQVRAYVQKYLFGEK